ncbi:MAG: alpha/beta fold hydrolase [Pseudomonadota bacterium]
MEGNLFTKFFSKLLEALRIKETASIAVLPDSRERRLRTPFEVVSDGLRIRGSIFYPAAKPSRLYPVLIISHGIPGGPNRKSESDPGYEGLAAEFTDLGVIAVIFNFRGCGESEGNFDMGGWSRDLEVVFDKVVNTPFVDPTRVLVLGYSAGGAAALTAFADNPKIYGLATAGTPAHFRIFDRRASDVIADFRQRGIIRDRDFPADSDRWYEGFVKAEPLKWISRFKGNSLLIVHGDCDELVPVDHARMLAERSPAGVGKLVVIEGGGHKLRLDVQCTRALKDWVVDTLGLKR